MTVVTTMVISTRVSTVTRVTTKMMTRAMRTTSMDLLLGEKQRIFVNVVTAPTQRRLRPLSTTMASATSQTTTATTLTTTRMGTRTVPPSTPRNLNSPMIMIGCGITAAVAAATLTSSSTAATAATKVDKFTIDNAITISGSVTRTEASSSILSSSSPPSTSENISSQHHYCQTRDRLEIRDNGDDNDNTENDDYIDVDDGGEWRPVRRDFDIYIDKHDVQVSDLWKLVRAFQRDGLEVWPWVWTQPNNDGPHHVFVGPVTVDTVNQIQYVKRHIPNVNILVITDTYSLKNPVLPNIDVDRQDVRKDTKIEQRVKECTEKDGHGTSSYHPTGEEALRPYECGIVVDTSVGLIDWKNRIIMLDDERIINYNVLYAS